MPNTKLTVRDDQDNILGHVSNWGCQNPACTEEIVNGRKWHAVPQARYGVTFPSYHFRCPEDAIQALHEVWLA